MFYVIGNVYEHNGSSLNPFLLELAIALNKIDETGILTALGERDSEWFNKLEQCVNASYHTVTNQNGILEEWDLEPMFDVIENDIVILHQNLGESFISSISSYGVNYGCTFILLYDDHPVISAEHTFQTTSVKDVYDLILKIKRSQQH